MQLNLKLMSVFLFFLMPCVYLALNQCVAESERLSAVRAVPFLFPRTGPLLGSLDRRCA